MRPSLSDSPQFSHSLRARGFLCLTKEKALVIFWMPRDGWLRRYSSNSPRRNAAMARAGPFAGQGRKDSAYRSGRSPDWLKMKNSNAPAVKREAEEDWAR